MSNETTEKAYDYREDPEYWRAPFDFTKPLLDVNTPEGWMRAELNGRSFNAPASRPGAEYEWCLAEIKRRYEAQEFPFDDSEVTLLYREKVANGELPDVYAGTPYDLALLPF
ncbi:hypothetical protein [Rothia mucilaginosa]|uniref:hypothetical protein n=1 Tax=Rothia mucilaginosa TaxID=43675 RepID=UPI0026F20D4F|nr:hypothetical protein [Rothia mucilaginosa]